MKHIKSIIIAVTIIITILIIALVLLLTNKKEDVNEANNVSINTVTNTNVTQNTNKNNNNTTVQQNTTNNNNREIIKEEEETEDNSLESKIKPQEYFIVTSCAQDYIYALNKKVFTIEENQRNCLYNILSTNYKKDNGITKSNVLEKLTLLEENMKFIPLEIQRLSTDNLRNYKVSGIYESLAGDNINSTKVYFIVNLSLKDQTYSVEPISEEKYKDSENRPSPAKIEKNLYNKYVNDSPSTEKIATEFFQKYIYLTIANPQYTYERMPENNRNKQFGSLDDYKNYVKENLNKIKNLKLVLYKANLLQNGNMQYEVRDEDETRYIFEAKDMLNYSIQIEK